MNSDEPNRVEANNEVLDPTAHPTATFEVSEPAQLDTATLEAGDPVASLADNGVLEFQLIVDHAALVPPAPLPPQVLEGSAGELVGPVPR